MPVIGSSGSSEAVYSSGFGGAEDLVSGAAVAVDYSVGIAFGGYCPNLLLCFLQMGQFCPHPHHSSFCRAVALGDRMFLGLGLYLYGGF